MADVPERENAITIPLAWVIPDEMPVNASNQFLGQAVAPDEVLLTFGYVAPPAILGGTDEERRAQAERLSFVPVQAQARFSMSRARLDELWKVLDETRRNHDALFRGGEQAS